MDIWYKFWSDTLKNVEWIALPGKFVDRKWPQVGYFEFDQVEIFHALSQPETAQMVKLSGLVFQILRILQK